MHQAIRHAAHVKSNQGDCDYRDLEDKLLVMDEVLDGLSKANKAQLDRMIEVMRRFKETINNISQE